MERWDIYDINRIKTGKTVIRGVDPLGDGEYHLVAMIVVFSSDGRMLIQKRKKTKAGWPGMWDISAGGAVTEGEDSALGAERELFEEIGISHSFAGVRPRFSISHRLGFADCYVITKDVDPASLKLQESEVDEVRYATVDEVLSMIEEGIFIPYYESVIRLMFDMKDSYGAHKK